MADFWKNKKILVYIALAHHTRFISPVMEKLIHRGAKVSYIVGQAERSQEITAITLGLDYTHVFDWLSEKDQTDIQTNYLRLRNALSKSLNTSFLYSATPATVIDKTIRATAMEYIGFRNIIDQTRPDICFALHELNRWGKMFAFWAKKCNVPVLTFQEGLYYGTNYGYSGHLQYSTFNLVWGNRVKRKLTDFEAPADRIIIVGNTHLANEAQLQKKCGIRQKMRKKHRCQKRLAILLLFSGEIADIAELHPLFESNASPGKRKLFIKFHPVTRQDQIDQWTSLIPPKYKPFITVFSGNENLYNLLSMSDMVVLTQSSTTGLEALFFNKPLVLLDVKTRHKLPYSFTEFNVAVKMTPQKFAEAIARSIDFTKLIKKEDIKQYLDDELSGTNKAIDHVIGISEKVISARKEKNPAALASPVKITRAWSIVIELPRSPEKILRQLETVALNSENSGSFEVILIEPVTVSKESTQILDSLKGDLVRLKTRPGQSLFQMMNRAAKAASGNTLVFLEKNILPGPGWLGHFKRGVQKYPGNTIFGARILDKTGSIIHAGIIIDQNNAPVSAYKYLPADFPNALKERPFEMIDHAMAMNRSAFCRMGGFWEKSGTYGFMEISLRVSRSNNAECIYLPKVCLTALENDRPDDLEGALQFYAKWHGSLWENQNEFYKKDQISMEELDTARLTQSLATV